jgi:hypothetical protein
MIINTILLHNEFLKKFVLHNINFDMVEWIETNYAISPHKKKICIITSSNLQVKTNGNGTLTQNNNKPSNKINVKQTQNGKHIHPLAWRKAILY